MHTRMAFLIICVFCVVCGAVLGWAARAVWALIEHDPPADDYWTDHDRGDGGAGW